MKAAHKRRQPQGIFQTQRYRLQCPGHGAGAGKGQTCCQVNENCNEIPVLGASFLRMDAQRARESLILDLLIADIH